MTIITAYKQTYPKRRIESLANQKMYGAMQQLIWWEQKESNLKRELYCIERKLRNVKEARNLTDVTETRDGFETGYKSVWRTGMWRRDVKVRMLEDYMDLFVVPYMVGALKDVNHIDEREQARPWFRKHGVRWRKDERILIERPLIQMEVPDATGFSVNETAALLRNYGYRTGIDRST